MAANEDPFTGNMANMMTDSPTTNPANLMASSHSNDDTNAGGMTMASTPTHDNANASDFPMSDAGTPTKPGKKASYTDSPNPASRGKKGRFTKKKPEKKDAKKPSLKLLVKHHDKVDDSTDGNNESNAGGDLAEDDEQGNVSRVPKVTKKDKSMAPASILETSKKPVKTTPKRSQDEDNTDGTNEDSASGSNKKTKKNLRIVSHDARSPLKTSYVMFDTAHYTKYDPKKKNIGNPGPSTFTKFSDYDKLTLFSVAPITDHKIIPRGGVVRLDDYAVAIIAANAGVKERSTQFPAEFDKQGMTRATRMPLGIAAKAYQSVGTCDLDGNVVQEGEAGWYYQWYKGLQPLCGKEGYDAGFYLIRPSFEKPRVPLFGFKISHKAVIQEAPGEGEENKDGSDTGKKDTGKKDTGKKDKDKDTKGSDKPDANAGGEAPAVPVGPVGSS